MSFALVTIIGLSCALPPALVIVWKARLRRPRQLWHKPEAAIVLAFIFDATRRIWILASGTPTKPGLHWTIASGFTTGFMALVLWARVASIVRHDIRNRDLSASARVQIARYNQQQQERDES